MQKNTKQTLCTLKGKDGKCLQKLRRMIHLPASRQAQDWYEAPVRNYRRSPDSVALPDWLPSSASHCIGIDQAPMAVSSAGASPGLSPTADLATSLADAQHMSNFKMVQEPENPPKTGSPSTAIENCNGHPYECFTSA
mmetsp:Transcript_108381/g.191958  ORF Transcript_108381/g.191958 Transcript_108381/m.191958 type:complete len:138 (-) Transcript_108381:168-581(-)